MDAEKRSQGKRGVREPKNVRERLRSRYRYGELSAAMERARVEPLVWAWRCCVSVPPRLGLCSPATCSLHETTAPTDRGGASRNVGRRRRDGRPRDGALAGAVPAGLDLAKLKERTDDLDLCGRRGRGGRGPHLKISDEGGPRIGCWHKPAIMRVAAPGGFSFPPWCTLVPGPLCLLVPLPDRRH